MADFEMTDQGGLEVMDQKVIEHRKGKLERTAHWGNESLRIFAACIHEGCHQMVMVHAKDRTGEFFTTNIPLDKPAVVIATRCPKHEGLSYNAWKTAWRVMQRCHPGCWCDTAVFPHNDSMRLRLQKAAAIMGATVPLLTPAMAMYLCDAERLRPDDLVGNLEGMNMATGSTVVYKSFWDFTCDAHYSSELWGVTADMANVPDVVPGQPNEQLLVRWKTAEYYAPSLE